MNRYPTDRQVIESFETHGHRIDVQSYDGKNLWYEVYGVDCEQCDTLTTRRDAVKLAKLCYRCNGRPIAG